MTQFRIWAGGEILHIDEIEYISGDFHVAATVPKDLSLVPVGYRVSACSGDLGEAFRDLAAQIDRIAEGR